MTDYQKGFEAGFKYWTDRPHLIEMPNVKRKWLHEQSEDFVNGFHAGADEVDKAERGYKCINDLADALEELSEPEVEHEYGLTGGERLRCRRCLSAQTRCVGSGGRFIALDDYVEYENWLCDGCGTRCGFPSSVPAHPRGAGGRFR